MKKDKKTTPHPKGENKMTKERVKELAKAIYNMHGLADSRKQEKFLFDGKIFFYNINSRHQPVQLQP